MLNIPVEEHGVGALMSNIEYVRPFTHQRYLGGHELFWWNMPTGPSSQARELLQDLEATAQALTSWLPQSHGKLEQGKSKNAEHSIAELSRSRFSTMGFSYDTHDSSIALIGTPEIWIPSTVYSTAFDTRLRSTTDQSVTRWVLGPVFGGKRDSPS